MIDLNQAGEQRELGQLIPDGALVKVRSQIRAGNAGPDGWLTQSRTSHVQYLDFEFTVMGGDFDGYRFWENMTVSGTEKGVAEHISLAKIKAMVESAFGILPTDEGASAQARRRLMSYGNLSGLEFGVKVAVEKGKGEYKDKNKIALIITPDRKEYQEVMEGPAQAVFPVAGGDSGSSAPAAPAAPASPAPACPDPSGPTLSAPGWAQ